MGERAAADVGGSFGTGPLRTRRGARGRDRRDRSDRTGRRDRNPSGGRARRGREAEAQGAGEEAIDQEVSRREAGGRRCVELTFFPNSSRRQGCENTNEYDADLAQR